MILITCKDRRKMNRLLFSLLVLSFSFVSEGGTISLQVKSFHYGTLALCDANLSDYANEYIWKCVMTYFEPLQPFFECIDTVGAATLKDYLTRFCNANGHLPSGFYFCMMNKSTTQHMWNSNAEVGLFKYCLKKYQLEEEEEEEEDWSID
ncbi:uncharacterized protein LOC111615512 [Centruroides sculpturatus]|uniref:uncharacterized protein LOC111615512 n=1 Tax=Centruroides sculpturatus TaxID=218467 RepID=UPI000C6E032F|nr:uncharacterized protein LOC111615512 [Centruroides sculpturatus]